VYQINNFKQLKLSCNQRIMIIRVFVLTLTKADGCAKELDQSIVRKNFIDVEGLLLMRLLLLQKNEQGEGQRAVFAKLHPHDCSDFVGTSHGDA
jgi:hypothetical protein